MKLINFKPLLLLLVAIGLFTFSCRHKAASGWTAQSKKSFHDELYGVADTLLTTEKDKQAFADCGLEKAMTLLPDGLSSVPTDSLKAVISRVSQSCIAEKQALVNIWNPQIERAIKSKLMAYPAVQHLKPQYREAFCDCYLDTVKQLYPNGITGALPVQQQNEIAVNCIHKVAAQKSGKK